jgi:DeoR/GlpR family transcriptional regulator of sugar metabolism
MSPAIEKPATFFETHDSQQKDAKARIARRVFEKYLHEGDSIILDAGTTLYPIAEVIAEKTQKDPQKTHFTIMTHNYQGFETLVHGVGRDANLNIVLAGGRWDRDLNALFGPQTSMAYDKFFPRVVLLGVSGMMADHGLFCHGNTEELAVKQVIFRKGAQRRIIVADFTKLGVPDALCFGQSQHLRANVEECILITNTPSTDDERVLSRFQHEVDQLRSVYGVKVDPI